MLWGYQRTSTNLSFVIPTTLKKYSLFAPFKEEAPGAQRGRVTPWRIHRKFRVWMWIYTSDSKFRVLSILHYTLVATSISSPVLDFEPTGPDCKFSTQVQRWGPWVQIQWGRKWQFPSSLNSWSDGGTGKGPSSAYLITLGSFFYQSCVVGFVVLLDSRHVSYRGTCHQPHRSKDISLHALDISQLFRFWLHLREIHSLIFSTRFTKSQLGVIVSLTILLQRGHLRMLPGAPLLVMQLRQKLCPQSMVAGCCRISMHMGQITSSWSLLKLLMGHDGAKGFFKSVGSLEVTCGHWF